LQVRRRRFEHRRHHHVAHGLAPPLPGPHRRLQPAGQRAPGDRVPLLAPLAPHRGRAALAHQGLHHAPRGRERHPAGPERDRRRQDLAGGAQQGPHLARRAGRVGGRRPDHQRGAAADDLPAPGGDGSAQPGQHLLHERRPPSRLEHAPPHHVLPAGRAAVRAEQHEPAGDQGYGGEEVRGAVQGVVGGVDEERGPAEAALLRHKTRAAPRGRRPARLAGGSSRSRPPAVANDSSALGVAGVAAGRPPRGPESRGAQAVHRAQRFGRSAGRGRRRRGVGAAPGPRPLHHNRPLLRPAEEQGDLSDLRTRIGPVRPVQSVESAVADGKLHPLRGPR
jgi:hypothetical protein